MRWTVGYLWEYMDGNPKYEWQPLRTGTRGQCDFYARTVPNVWPDDDRLVSGGYLCVVPEGEVPSL